MKKYTSPDIELKLLVKGDILTFSVGQLDEFDSTGTDAPIINVDEGTSGVESN